MPCSLSGDTSCLVILQCVMLAYVRLHIHDSSFGFGLEALEFPEANENLRNDEGFRLKLWNIIQKGLLFYRISLEDREPNFCIMKIKIHVSLMH